MIYVTHCIICGSTYKIETKKEEKPKKNFNCLICENTELNNMDWKEENKKVDTKININYQSWEMV